MFRDVEALASQALAADPQYRALVALAVSEDALARTSSSPESGRRCDNKPGSTSRTRSD